MLKGESNPGLPFANVFTITAIADDNDNSIEDDNSLNKFSTLIKDILLQEDQSASIVWKYWIRHCVTRLRRVR